MCSHIQEIQGIGHTITAAETLKAAIRVLTPEKQKLLLRNIVIKENPCKERKDYQKVKAAQEDIGSQNQRGRNRTLRTTYPNHGDVMGAPECMKIFGFIHEITNPELIKRLHDKIPKSVDEMMRVTTTFIRGEVDASNRERKKPFLSWKQQEAEQSQNFKKESFWSQQRMEWKQGKFTLLIKTPK
nr:reverse transcriptase domain-containing protein [Tanacetum cinerariifolium]